ncbi:MAG: hypothetical protein NVS1B2_27000 [Vulcanimicrobiaceae bacterium]
MQAVQVAGFLTVWCVLGLALVRRAERGVAASTIPPPWRDLAIGLGLGAVAIAFHPAPQAATCGAACIALAVASSADARTGFLFDAITLPAAAVVATLAILAGTGSAAVAGVALLVGGFGAIAVVSHGRAIGLGDVKAMFAIGAAFGPLESLVVIFVACASGIATSALRGIFARGATIRFGPHLAVGSAFALVAGDPIVRALLGGAT